MKHRLALALAIAIAIPACTPAVKSDMPASSQQAQASNPFFADSTLPLQYPQFDKIKDSRLRARPSTPAWPSSCAEIDAIANNPAAPTFENTIVALEKSGQVLDRATTVFFNLIGADTNDAREKLQSRVCRRSCRRTATRSCSTPSCSRASRRCTTQRDTLGLDAEGVRLLERYHTDFVRAGASSTKPHKAQAARR